LFLQYKEATANGNLITLYRPQIFVSETMLRKYYYDKSNIGLNYVSGEYCTVIPCRPFNLVRDLGFSQRWRFKSRSPALRHHVEMLYHINVSEGHDASIFMVSPFI